MPTYDVTWNDERGQQELQYDDVVLEDGIYEFWRGNDAVLRVPADQINSRQKRADCAGPRGARTPAGGRRSRSPVTWTPRTATSCPTPPTPSRGNARSR